jgi:hypothetical protein
VLARPIDEQLPCFRHFLPKNLSRIFRKHSAIFLGTAIQVRPIRPTGSARAKIYGKDPHFDPLTVKIRTETAISP